ncbi:hypothetical protein LC613_08350 [Nostoc sphaeroides CHAB 2801]|uniref:hypothetical protein n=1 Tax=Nostoc sphaeroides TaxID=446679 RepID=UPI000E4DA06F|nr:hypothetical protein [Nostoc sphaeroides]MCC5628133.1 hypothetical protein [Nostoc sphaeroides CHAB 2801]
MNQLNREVFQVDIQGVFTFAIQGDASILNEYIIERIEQKLKQHQPERSKQRFEIRIHLENNDQTMLDAFLKQCNSNNFIDLLNAQINSDIVLLIWNYDIPVNHIKSSATSFFEYINSIYPTLIDTHRFIIIILANVDISSQSEINHHILGEINGLTVLDTPNKYELLELIPWAHQLFQEQNMEDAQIQQYLNRLKNQKGYFRPTYQEINAIIRELEGGTKRYG